jgi:ferrous iron transport protein B
MTSATLDSTLTVALIGNPNTGKSTLFTALVGVHQRVGNYPGVTVEKKSGQLDHAGRRYEIVDLPGLYSLTPRSLDELVSVDVLLGRSPGTAALDAVICVLDASNLDRHLYLLSQVLEAGLPTVVAVNMVDVAEEHGIAIDFARLADRLGIPVVPVQAHRRMGIDALKTAVAGTVGRHVAAPASPLPEVVQHEVDHLQRLLAEPSDGQPPLDALPTYLVQRLILDTQGQLQAALLPKANGRFRSELAAVRTRLAAAGHEVPGVETTARFDWARRVLEGVVSHPAEYKVTRTDRLDRLLTHRLWGTMIFALVMLAMFQSVFVGAEPLMNLIEWGKDALGGWVGSLMAEGALRSLLVDGVLAGAGGVLVFLPQICILFLFIAVLEDCGYMARAAFLMDRLMTCVGLSGKSFIPLLSSFACSVPGIMATRVIENPRDRLATILAAPMITCSARLPVYALLIAAFIPHQTYLGGLLNLQGLTLIGLYVLGILAAIAVAAVLKRTVLRGETPPFVMELPSYKWPSPRNVVLRVVERAVVFLRCAGTLILAVAVVVWAALYFPHDRESVEGPYRARLDALHARQAALAADSPDRTEVDVQVADVEHEIAGAYQRQSYLGRMGRAVEPVFKPLGWDWRISAAVIASFPAREVVVATLGVIYNLGNDVDTKTAEGFTQMSDRLQAATWDGTDRPVYTIPVALSIMIFFALCAQCAATLAVIRRETNSWRWPLLAFSYMTVLAYVGALVTYQLGTWIAG